MTFHFVIGRVFIGGKNQNENHNNNYENKTKTILYNSDKQQKSEPIPIPKPNYLLESYNNANNDSNNKIYLSYSQK